MPDEAPTTTPEAPENDTGTPTPAAPDTGAPAEPEGGSPDSPDSTDWKQRYEDLRPEADRRQTELDDLDGRNGPERQRAAFERRGISLEDQEGADEFDDDELDEFDDLPDPDERVEQLDQRLTQREEAEEQARFQALEQDYIEETVESLEEEFDLSEQLTDHEYDLVVNYALSNRDPQDGKPDLKGGMEALIESQKAAQKRYGKSKQDADLPPPGAEGEPKIDMRDPEARKKVGREAFQRHQQSVSSD
jgi:hypothetical protein